MRDIVINKVNNYAKFNKDFILVTADLGFGIFDDFRQSFSDQFINVGIAEQNLIGVSVGLAITGKKVFCYSIGNFPSLRCLEQIRNDAAYHEVNLCIIASGGGFNYGQLGMSHHATEDLGILRCLPNLTVLSPCSEYEASECVSYLLENNIGVSYLRLEKLAQKIRFPNEQNFKFGAINLISEGNDLSIISTGGVLDNVFSASMEMKKNNINVDILSVHCVKPFDENTIIRSAIKTRNVLVVEEHNMIGGLGSAVIETLYKNKIEANLCHLSIQDQYISTVGDQAYLRTFCGLDSKSIYESAIKLINKSL